MLRICIIVLTGNGPESCKLCRNIKDSESGAKRMAYSTHRSSTQSRLVSMVIWWECAQQETSLLRQPLLTYLGACSSLTLTFASGVPILSNSSRSTLDSLNCTMIMSTCEYLFGSGMKEPKEKPASGSHTSTLSISPTYRCFGTILSFCSFKMLS